MWWWLKHRNQAQRVKRSLVYSQKKRKEIQGTVNDIRTTLNGEDHWFLKICDSDDPEEKECPPNYDNRKKE